MSIAKQLFRWLFVACLVVLMVAAVALAYLTQTERGRNSLASLVSSMISNDETRIDISGLKSVWPLSVDHIVLEDAEGPWLTVRDVDVDWALRPLLNSTFEARRIFAGRLEIFRQPKAARSDGGSGGSGTLPVSLAIERIELPDIALGEALAGTAAELSAQGSLYVINDPLDVDIRLKLARIDGVGGNLDAAVRFAPSRRQLDMEVKGSEPAGGIVADLLGLPGAPPVAIVINGKGAADDWRGQGVFSVDGTPVTTVSGLYQTVENGRRIELSGNGEFERFVPQGLRSLVAGKVDFDIAGLLGDQGRIDVEKAELQSASLRASAQGSIDPQGVNDLTFQTETIGGPVGVSFGPQLRAALGNADIHIYGEGNASRIEAKMALANVATEAGELRDIVVAARSDGFDLFNQAGPLTVDLAAESFSSENALLQPLMNGRIEANLSAEINQEAIAIAGANMRSDAFRVDFGGQVSRRDSSLSLAFVSDIVSAALPEQARSALGERVALSGNVKRDGAGAVSVEQMALKSGDLSVGGTLAVQGDTINAALTGSLADLQRLAPEASGAISFVLDATGRLLAPEVTFTARSDAVGFAGHEFSGVELAAKAVTDLASPMADVSLTGLHGGQKLNGSASLRTVDGRREVRDLSVVLGENRISGNLVLDENFIPEGEIDIKVPDIGPLAALAFEQMGGGLDGKILFHKTDGVATIALDARAASLSRANVALKDVAVAATLGNYAVSPVISGTIHAGSITSGNTIVGNVDVKLSQDGDWTGFSGAATVNAIPARTAGRVKIAGGETTVELASGEATIQGLKVALAQAATIVVRDATAAFDGLALAVSGGRVAVSGTAGETLALDIQLSSLPAAVVNAFAPTLGASGTISGTAHVSGAASAPVIAYKAQWANAGTAQTGTADLGAMTVNSSGNFAGGKLEFQADVAGASGLSVKGGGTVGTEGTPTLALDFSGRAPFALVARQLAAQGLSLTGAADFGIQLQGNASAPVIGGTVRTSGARLVVAASGMAIEGIGADISIGAGVATLRSLSGKLSTGGTISGSGTVGIDPAGGFPADLSVRIVDGRYTDGRIVTTTANGDLTLKGPLAGMSTLGGTINLGRTVITIPERLPSSLANLNVRHRNAPQAVIVQKEAILPPQAKSSGEAKSGLTLDIQVNAPQEIFVQGRGLDAELGGSLKLAGPAATPQAIGSLAMKRGRLQILARRLTFSRGTLDFDGSLVPNLDLAADATISSTTVTVQVVGPADDLKFVFSSSPVLPEDEVLALLIFGRSLSSLSPLQIAQLADAMAQLAGKSSSATVLNNLRNSLGIDDLDITTDAEGNTAVSAGKYLNDRTYLSVEKGGSAGSGKATIDLEVGRGIKLRGSAAEDGEATGGIFFEREY